jgi:hypothetical protein
MDEKKRLESDTVHLGESTDSKVPEVRDCTDMECFENVR